MPDTLRQYNNKLWLDFEERGENFTLKVPHKPVWDAIIRFLRNRGWKISENPSYKKHYKCLSKFHKIGFKGTNALLMEITPIQIELHFGHKKNLWTGISQSFWEKGDSFDRYTKLTYLEEVSVKLEIHKTKEFCKKWLQVEKMDHEKSAVECILEGEARNKHIHGGATSLEHLKELMINLYSNSYQSNYNLKDRDKKIIYCGQHKYFFDYKTKRVFRGIVYHNINNMWWVILPCGALRNIACFDLFDIEGVYVKRRKLTPTQKSNIIQSLTENALENRDFIRVSSLAKALENLIKEVTNG